MISTFQPAPVSSRRITWKGNSGSCDASDLNGTGQVYGDACDTGFTVVSERTGQSVVFVEGDEKRDREGELLYTVYWSVDGRFSITVYND